MDVVNGSDSEDGWGGDRHSAPAAPTRLSPSAANAARRPTEDNASVHYAAHLADTSASAFMYFCMAGVFRQADAPAYKLFRDRLLLECGSPTDPIEIMIIEQLALAHLNTGRLHFKSATAEALEAARTYGALAIALGGEFRRGALALKSYRTKPQAGAVATSAAEVVGPDADAAQEGIVGELDSNDGGDEHGERTIPLPESQAGRGREAEQGHANRSKRRRA